MNCSHNTEQEDDGRDDASAQPIMPDVLKTTIWQDICSSVYDGRYVSTFVLLLALYIGYSLTLAPYQISRPSLTAEQRSLDALKYIRPVLSEAKTKDIYISTLYGETSFEMPSPSFDTIRLKFHAQASKHGHFRAPDLFYQGVVFGLTWQNSHDLEYYRQDSTPDELQAVLLNMEPKPSKIFLRSSRNNATGWRESGFAVHFANSDLLMQGMLSSDLSQPWKRTREAVLRVARDFKLAYVYLWYPHQFGATNIDDPYKHVVLIQEIMPTRTGLDGLKSSATVWLSAVNFTEPFHPPRIVRKEWSADDHWSNYPVEN